MLCYYQDNLGHSATYQHHADAIQSLAFDSHLCLMASAAGSSLCLWKLQPNSDRPLISSVTRTHIVISAFSNFFGSTHTLQALLLTAYIFWMQAKHFWLYTLSRMKRTLPFFAMTCIYLTNYGSESNSWLLRGSPSNQSTLKAECLKMISVTSSC